MKRGPSLLDQRFFRQFLPPVMGVLLAVATLTGWLGFQHAKRQVLDDGQRLLSLYAASLKKPLWDVDSEAVQAIVDVLNASPNVRGVALRDETQKVSFSAGEPIHASRGDILEAALIYTDTQNRQYPLGTLRLQLQQPAAWQTMQAGLTTFLPLLIAAVIAVVVTGVAVNRRLVTRPLETFRQAIESSRTGKDPVLSPEMLPPDELGDVMRAYLSESRQRQTVERQLSANQDRLRLVTANLPNAYLFQCHRDTEGRLVYSYVSQSIRNVLGIEPEAVYRDGNVVRNLVDPAYLPALLAADEAAISTGRDFSFDCPMVLPDGQRRWAHLTSRRTPSPGRDNTYSGFHLDITEIRETQEELRRSREDARAIIEAMADPVFIHPWSGAHQTPNFIEVNQSACRFLGMTREELLTTGPGRLDDITVETGTAVIQKINQTGSATFESVFLHKDGTRIPVEINTSVVEISGRPTAIAVARSLVDRKRREEELQEAIRRAEAANIAKSEFIANMSHEIRTPMNAIVGFSEILARSLVDDDKRHKALTIAESGRNLLALVNDILDLSKIEAGRLDIRPSLVSLTDLFRDVHLFFSNQAGEKNLTFSLDLPPNLPDRAWLDEIRLRQILINLVGNAVKFTESGSIVLKLEVLPESGDPHHCELLISVIDTGIGIPDAFKSRIFEHFEQVPTQGQTPAGGTGLGLPIATHLAHLMGGRLSVHDNPVGTGSVFQLTLSQVKLPEKRSEDTPPRQAPNRSPIVPRIETIRFPTPPLVLVADDMPNNIELIQAYLRDHGFPIVTASNGRQALEIALARKPGLILTDIRMPVLDGRRFLHELRHSSEPALHSVPVIAITASAMPGQISADQTLFDGLLIKPISQGTLLREIARFLPHHFETVVPPSTNAGEKPPNLEKTIGLLAEMGGGIEQEIQAVQKHLHIREAADLARSLSRLGDQYEAPFLHQAASQLAEAARNFQVAVITQTLRDLAQHLEKLRTFVNAHPLPEENTES